jgi:sugar phosphate isomerase/epimerase
MIIAVSLLGLLEEESLDNVLHTVKRYGIEYVELPLTYILKKKWQDIEVKEVEDLRFKIHRSGLKVNSLQSITYGLDFDICKLNKDDYLYLSKHFDQVAVYASMLGAKHVVYGSPSTRTGDNTKEYTKFFDFVSSVFSKRGISFCLENNARVFNNNFGYESNFIYKFIKESNIDNIYSHFDTGNEYIESGSMPNADYVKSIHISNNKYANFMKNESYIKYINECLKNIDGIESITMENINMDEDYELLINRFKCIVLDI